MSWITQPTVHLVLNVISLAMPQWRWVSHLNLSIRVIDEQFVSFRFVIDGRKRRGEREGQTCQLPCSKIIAAVLNDHDNVARTAAKSN